MIYHLVQILVWLSSTFIGKAFLNIEVRGAENLKQIKPRGVIFAANHQGYFDPFMITGASLPWRYVKKQKAFRYMTHYRFLFKCWFSPAMWLMGCYPVWPGRKDLARSTRSSIKMIKKGYDLMIFPTGRIVVDFLPGDAKQGIGYVASKTRATIMPAYIQGTHKIPAGDFFLRRRKVKVIFGRPLKYDDYSHLSENPAALSHYIMGKIKELGSAPRLSAG